MLSIVLATAPMLLGGGWPSQTVGCRVTPRMTGWSEVRTVNPWTEPEPATFVRIDVCAITEWILRYENRASYENLCEFRDMRVRVQASFEPTFAVLFADFDVPTPAVLLAEDPFDGADDYAGTSGIVTMTPQESLQHTVFASIRDDAPFRVPFQVYVRAFATSTIDGATITAECDSFCGAGVSFAFLSL